MITDAYILAGGLGTRLRSAVDDRPKVLADVAGRPFITYLLEKLATAAIERVVIGVAYMADTIKAELGHQFGPMEIVYIEEETPLGTGGALRLAYSVFADGPIVVMNGDSYLDLDVTDFINSHNGTYSGTLAVTQVPDAGRYGSVELNSHGAITAFREKNNRGRPGRINAGVYLLTDRLIQSIPAHTRLSLEHEVFPNHQLGGYLCEGRFIDIGTPESYAAAQTFFRTAVSTCPSEPCESAQ